MKLATVLAAASLSIAATAAAAVEGPIRVGKDGRHFVDQKGTPFFWLGDTAWPLFAQYSKAQAEAYLQNRGEKGFTVIQGVLAWGLGSGMEQKTPMANALGQKPWLDDDPAHAQRGLLRARRPARRLRQPEGPRARDAPDLGLLREGVPGREHEERPRLRPLARRALQERAQRRLGERRRPHAHRIRGRVPRARPGPARRRRRRAPHHLPSLRLAVVRPVLPRRGLARLQHDRDLDRVVEDLPRRRLRLAARAAQARGPRRRRLRERPRVPAGPDHSLGGPPPGLVDGDGRRLPHLRPEPDVAHGDGLGQDLRHARRRPGLPDEAHRDVAPVAGPRSRPGRLRDRHRQRALAQRRDAFERRQARPRLPRRAPRRSSSTSTRSRRRTRRPPGSARSPASARTPAPTPRAT